MTSYRASRRHRRLPRCRGKVAYPTERAALKSAQRCNTARGTELRVYECPICECWHLTKQIQQRSMYQ